jgi:hypothetical protein
MNELPGRYIDIPRTEQVWKNQYSEKFNKCFCESCNGLVHGYLSHVLERTPEDNLIVAKAIYAACAENYDQEIL